MKKGIRTAKKAATDKKIPAAADPRETGNRNEALSRKERLIRFVLLIGTHWFAEYRRIFADPAVLLLFFGVMILYPAVYPIPFYHQIVRELPVAAVDYDQTSMSRQLLRMADQSETIHITHRTLSFADAKEKFYRNEVRGIIVIPKDFSKNILKGVRASVVVYTDASYFLIYRQVYTGVAQAVGTLSAGIEVKKLLAKGNARSQAIALRDPVPVETVPLYNTNGAYGSYLVPAVLILILQQTLLIGIGLLGGSLREKNALHFIIPDHEKVRFVTPVILGKSLAYFSMYVIHIVYFFGVLFKIYSYPQHANIFVILLFFVPFLFSIIFLALALSTIFRSRESSLMLLLCTSIPFMLFSGMSWPAVSIPSWLRQLSLLIPSTMGIDGFIKLNMMGASFSEVLKNWGILWILTILFFMFAVVMFRRVLRIKKKDGFVV
jgi:ABC-2 type transport system permease protein